MAKKTSNYPVEGFDYRWGYNKETGEKAQTPDKLPHSGEQIRKYLGEKFTEVEGRLDIVEEKLEMGSLSLGFTDTPSGIIVINGTAPYYFPMKIRSVMVMPDNSEVEYDRQVNLTIEVSFNGRIVSTSLGRVDANVPISVNVTPYVSDGSVFAFRVTNDDGNTKRSGYYDVAMANIGLGVANNLWWAIPYIDGQQWNVPLKINVNVPAVLKATITDGNGIIRSSTTIPSALLSENYNLTFTHPIRNGGETGLYHLKVEMYATEESGIEMAADPLEYNICCVDVNDTNNYLLINNRGKDFKNYTANRLFDYAVRIGYGNPTIRFKSLVDGTVVKDTGDIRALSSVSSYVLSIDLERLDTDDFNVNVEAYIGTDLTTTETFVFSNKEGYAAIPGAKTLIRFNGRSNNEVNRDKFYNAITGREIVPIFNDGISWTGADGYHDETLPDGSVRTAFRILAGGKMTLPIKPLSMRATEGRTIEILYKVNNVRNFDTHVIECLDESKNGMYFTPSEIALQTPSALKYDDQNAGVDYTEVIHATIVVRPQPTGAVTVDNFNACMIFLNGCRNKWFSYNRDLNVDSNIVFGSEDSDIDIFAIRVYDKVLSEQEVEQNACNMKATEAEKKAYKERNAVREAGKVDFNRVRSMCNVIIFDAPTLPTRSWTKEMTTPAVIETYMVGADKVSVNVENLAWQGTTSHNYGIDNIYGGYGQNYKWTAPDGTKMCAKANWASSMQSHKIALTSAYTDLAVACGIIPNTQRISILQKPMVGFHRKTDGTLTYIGLFTVGADKGNKSTFSWTNHSLFMEGLDNEPLGTNFLAPWNYATASVDGANEKWSIMGVKSWEDASKKPAYINSVWVPAYNFVYGCSQQILPFDGLVSDMSAETLDTSTSYWLTSDDTMSGAMMYELFYYNSKQRTWMSADINLNAQLVDKGYGLTASDLRGKTPEEKNDLFKEARKVKFKKEVETYFNKEFFLYHTCFGEFFACTDNLSKNTYPFVLDCTGSDKRICWRQDDLDSAISTENQGKNYKKYCVEVTDNYSEYGRDDLMVFNGTKNQFWLLVRECYSHEIEVFMRERFIPTLQYGQASSAINSFLAWCNHYFFDNAQNHFPEALYNECGRLRYGYGHLSTGNEGEEGGYQYQGIALSQDCGNYYLAEKAWLRMRFIYMTSKYLCGQFAGGATGDTFTTRPYSAEEGNTFEITPAIYMYPSVQNGQTPIRGYRIYPGNPQKSWSVTLPATEGDQEQRINGMSYIAELGPIYNAAIRGNVNVNGRMLIKLDMGTRTDITNIRSHITGLGIGDATSLRELTLANLDTLSGVVDLSQCVNLKKMYAEGTGITSVPLCDGGTLEVLYLPATTTTLSLIGKKKLTSLVLEGTDDIKEIEATDCNQYTMTEVLNILNEVYQ